MRLILLFFVTVGAWAADGRVTIAVRGDSVVLQGLDPTGQGYLAATALGDVDPTTVTWSVRLQPVRGILRFTDASQSVIITPDGPTFTQADVLAGKLSYVHFESSIGITSDAFILAPALPGTLPSSEWLMEVVIDQRTPDLAWASAQPALWFESSSDNSAAAILSPTATISAFPSTVSLVSCAIRIRDPVPSDILYVSTWLGVIPRLAPESGYLLSKGGRDVAALDRTSDDVMLTFVSDITTAEAEACLRSFAFSHTTNDPQRTQRSVEATLSARDQLTGEILTSRTRSQEVLLTLYNNEPGIAVISDNALTFFRLLGDPGSPVGLFSLAVVPGIAQEIRIPVFDPEGDPLRFEVGLAPSRGRLLGGAGGAFTYIHPAGVDADQDNFVVVAVDSGGATLTALISVDVVGGGNLQQRWVVDDPPMVATPGEELTLRFSPAPGSDIPGPLSVRSIIKTGLQDQIVSTSLNEETRPLTAVIRIGSPTDTARTLRLLFAITNAAPGGGAAIPVPVTIHIPAATGAALLGGDG
jgi:hypothetical protein